MNDCVNQFGFRKNIHSIELPPDGPTKSDINIYIYVCIRKIENNEKKQNPLSQKNYSHNQQKSNG